MWLASTSAKPTFFFTKPEVFARSRSAMISAYLAPKKTSTTANSGTDLSMPCSAMPSVHGSKVPFELGQSWQKLMQPQCTTASLASPEDPGANGRLEPELSKTFLQIAKSEN